MTPSPGSSGTLMKKTETKIPSRKKIQPEKVAISAALPL